MFDLHPMQKVWTDAELSECFMDTKFGISVIKHVLCTHSVSFAFQILVNLAVLLLYLVLLHVNTGTAEEDDANYRLRSSFVIADKFRLTCLGRVPIWFGVTNLNGRNSNEKWSWRENQTIRRVIYQPFIFFPSPAFQWNQRAFLHSSLATDKNPVIAQGKCRVQRMFAKHWAFTISFAAICFFISDLSPFLLIRRSWFISVKGLNLIPSVLIFSTVMNVKTIYIMYIAAGG